MVSARKRGRQEFEPVDEPRPEPSLLERIRNTWEFAALVQWIYIFGRAIKVDENLDVEELEKECLKSHSTILAEIGLALLKFVSSHRGLTPEIFDEYTRRQYVAKAPQRNPYGTEGEPANFATFDIFIRIRVLQQLTQWTMVSPDRIRERMFEQKDAQQTVWRIEPYGWDSQDREYYVLDDNRLYRKTIPPASPPTPAKPKKNSKKAKAAQRASKRRKLSDSAESEAEARGEVHEKMIARGDYGLGGAKWECVAVTLTDLNAYIVTLERSRDSNEKHLRDQLRKHLLPILERQEECRRRKAAQKEREMLNAEKLATAKRSSRIAGKLEQQKQDDEAREAERKQRTELTMAKKEQEKWTKLEKERESRMMTREQRLKEREARRILHEEELMNLSEDDKKVAAGESRQSSRHIKSEIRRRKQELEQLAEDDDWIFDCICGAYGQIDDGTHSIACENCNIWQHSKCVGVSQAEADRDDFHFICRTCTRRAEDVERAKYRPPIKIKLSGPSSSLSTTNSKSIPAVVIKQPYNDGQGSPPSQDASAKSAAMPQMHVFQTNGQSYQPLEHVSIPAEKVPYQTESQSSANGYTTPYDSPPTYTTPSQDAQCVHLHQSPRRSSLDHSSPTFGGPVLNPTNNTTTKPYGSPYSTAGFHSGIAGSIMGNGTVETHQSPSIQCSKPAGQQSTRVATNSPNHLNIYNSDPSQASVLPPASTGLSPTKHSPPRPAAMPGSIAATPSFLPPVAPMTPSPPVQNLVPPVKSSPPAPYQPLNGSTVNTQNP